MYLKEFQVSDSHFLHLPLSVFLFMVNGTTFHTYHYSYFRIIIEDSLSLIFHMQISSSIGSIITYG